MATKKISDYHTSLSSVTNPDGTESLIASTTDGGDKKIQISTLTKKCVLPYLQGIADDSSARTDPFLFLGEYDNDDTSTGLEKAMAALNGLDYSQTKYAGLVRLRVNGVPVDVHNYVRGYAAKHITQTIEGAIVVTDGEITSINSGTFAKYWRNIQGENIGKWQKYGESTGNGSTTDLTSVEARLAALEKNCICKNLGYAPDWNTVINTIGELENVADYTHPVQLIYQSGGSYTGVVVNTFDGTDCWQTFHWGSVIMRRKIILSGENYSHTAISSIGDWQTIVSGLGQ